MPKRAAARRSTLCRGEVAPTAPGWPPLLGKEGWREAPGWSAPQRPGTAPPGNPAPRTAGSSAARSPQTRRARRQPASSRPRHRRCRAHAESRRRSRATVPAWHRTPARRVARCAALCPRDRHCAGTALRPSCRPARAAAAPRSTARTRPASSPCACPRGGQSAARTTATTVRGSLSAMRSCRSERPGLSRISQLKDRYHAASSSPMRCGLSSCR